MNRNFPKSLDLQAWKINFWEITSWIKELLEWFRDFFSFWISEILDNPEDKNLDNFILMISSWAYPQMTDDSKDRFFRKQSRAKDEWCVKINDLVDLWNLKNLYESDLVNYWSNDDDFSFYEVETMYEWRRLRVIFYNSAYYKDRRKLSFEELVEKNEPVRVCFY